VKDGSGDCGEGHGGHHNRHQQSIVTLNASVSPKCWWRSCCHTCSGGLSSRDPVDNSDKLESCGSFSVMCHRYDTVPEPHDVLLAPLPDRLELMVPWLRYWHEGARPRSRCLARDRTHQNIGQFRLAAVTGTPWILDLDATVKCLYGKQEGTLIGDSPTKRGPFHAQHAGDLGVARCAAERAASCLAARRRDRAGASNTSLHSLKNQILCSFNT